MAGKGPVVLDEAQHWPELFARLRGEIQRKQNGRFILLGSIAPSLMRNVGSPWRAAWPWWNWRRSLWAK